jgi:hypothetical protein
MLLAKAISETVTRLAVAEVNDIKPEYLKKYDPFLGIR